MLNIGPEVRERSGLHVDSASPEAAFACHMDDRGTLEVGKLRIWSSWEVTLGTSRVDELPDITVDMTVKGGRVAWERP